MMWSERARSGWWAAAGAVAVVGWVAALLTIPPSALLAATVVLGALSLLVTTGVENTRQEAERRPGRSGTPGEWRRLVDRSLTGTLGAVAALGLLQVSVAATALLALALAGTAPFALSSRGLGVPEQASVTPDAPPVGGTPTGTPRSPDPGSEAARPPFTASASSPASVGSMTTQELVLVWRRSYAEVARARSPHQLAAVAARRQELLDELERRDAHGVRLWLGSGARAASDPSRFLHRPAGPSAA